MSSTRNLQLDCIRTTDIAGARINVMSLSAEPSLVFWKEEYESFSHRNKRLSVLPLFGCIDANEVAQILERNGDGSVISL